MGLEVIRGFGDLLHTTARSTAATCAPHQSPAADYCHHNTIPKPKTLKFHNPKLKSGIRLLVPFIALSNRRVVNFNVQSLEVVLFSASDVSAISSVNTSKSGCFKPKSALEDILICWFTCAIKKRQHHLAPRMTARATTSVKHLVSRCWSPNAEKRAGLSAAEPLIFRSANRRDRQLIKIHRNVRVSADKTST